MRRDHSGGGHAHGRGRGPQSGFEARRDAQNSRWRQLQPLRVRGSRRIAPKKGKKGSLRGRARSRARSRAAERLRSSSRRAELSAAAAPTAQSARVEKDRARSGALGVILNAPRHRSRSSNRASRAICAHSGGSLPRRLLDGRPRRRSRSTTIRRASLLSTGFRLPNR
jgi:hypothetical protein